MNKHHHHPHPHTGGGNEQKKAPAENAAPGQATPGTNPAEAPEAGEKVKNVNFKAAAQAYAEAQQTGEAAAQTAGSAPDAAEAPAAQATKPSAEPDYKLIAQKTLAEFDNFRKRVAKEKVQWKREALADFLKEFLPAFDDLTRAITEGEKAQSYETVQTGAKLVRDNLWKALEKAGVKEIPAAGKPFDPRFHEALTMLPMPDQKPDHVIEVYQAGYILDEHVLRPAKVVVSAPTAQ